LLAGTVVSDSGPIDLRYQYEHNAVKEVVGKFMGGPPEGMRANGENGSQRVLRADAVAFAMKRELCRLAEVNLTKGGRRAPESTKPAAGTPTTGLWHRKQTLLETKPINPLSLDRKDPLRVLPSLSWNRRPFPNQLRLDGFRANRRRFPFPADI